MNRIRDIQHRRQRAHGRWLEMKSKVYEAFLVLEAAAFADGALPRRQKELIAVGISVAHDCESCLEWHIRQAARVGATQREVLEAVEVGIEMAGGPATVAARFALEVMDDVYGAPEHNAGRVVQMRAAF